MTPLRASAIMTGEDPGSETIVGGTPVDSSPLCTKALVLGID